MSYNKKKILAVLLIVVIAFGWYITLFGIGSLKPIKDDIQLGLDIKGGVYVVMEAQTKATGDKLNELMDQTKEVITNRVDQMGLSNPNVTREGEKRIRVELPGAENAEEAIKQIGKTAQLQFKLADGTTVLTGSDVKDAGAEQDTEKGGYKVTLEFDANGGKKFEVATQKASSGQITSKMDNVGNNALAIMLDNDIISAPSVSNTITGTSCEITGSFSQEEASNLAALIRGGSLPTSLKEVTSSSQTATIGKDALAQSIFAGLIGLALIFLIMLLCYRIMGVAADIALLLYVVIIILLMALVRSVLTLPGIAGIILSIGMAVDANVVIFTRIKEEICGGKSIRVATQTGFRRAMGTVIDSQITTLIAAVVLYQVGTSAVKGFAWTLMIGIIASLLTAVVVTQLYLSIFSESKLFAKKKFFGIKPDNTASFSLKRQFSFIKHRKVYYTISIIVIAVGLISFGVRGLNYGIDFTGGTMLQVDMHRVVSTAEVKDVLVNQGIDIKNTDVIYSGDNNQGIMIKTRDSLNGTERSKLVSALGQKFGVTQKDVLSSENFGPTIGKELRNNAIKAILIAALGMLIYIRLRFREWKFGSAALIGVLHDVLWVVTFYTLFQVTVNNPFIAGILTVVGYSINDTIVIFDRIRENNRFMKRSQQMELIDTSINQTLSRSIMTSLTTIIVMVPLFVFTNDTIREFALPLMVGILVGCLSSIFLCSPLYYEFCHMGEKKRLERSKSKGGKKKYQGAPKKEKQTVDKIEKEEGDTNKASTGNSQTANNNSQNRSGGKSGNKNAHKKGKRKSTKK